MNTRILNFFKRFGWAVYILLLALALILLGLSHYVYQQGDSHDLLLNLSSELLGVGIVFFIVDQFFRWNPNIIYEEQQALILNELKTRSLTIQDEFKNGMEGASKDVLGKFYQDYYRLISTEFGNLPVSLLSSYLTKDKAIGKEIERSIEKMQAVINDQSPTTRIVAASLLQYHLNRWEYLLQEIQDGYTIYKPEDYYSIVNCFLRWCTDFVLTDVTIYNDPEKTWTDDFKEMLSHIQKKVQSTEGKPSGSAKYILFLSEEEASGKIDNLIEAKAYCDKHSFEYMFCDTSKVRIDQVRMHGNNSFFFFDEKLSIMQPAQVNWNEENDWKFTVKTINEDRLRLLRTIVKNAIPIQTFIDSVIKKQET